MFAIKENTMWKLTKTAFEKANAVAVAALKGFKSLEIFAHAFNFSTRSAGSLPLETTAAPRSFLGLNIPPPGPPTSVTRDDRPNATLSSRYEDHHGLSYSILSVAKPNGRPVIAESSLGMASWCDTVPLEDDDECELPDATYNAINNLLDETEFELPKDSFASLTGRTTSPHISPLPSLVSSRSSSRASSRASSALLKTPITILPFNDYTIFDAPEEYFLSSQPVAEQATLIAEGVKGRDKEDFVYDPLEEEEQARWDFERRWKQ
ncbi:hypothetical protein M422DRAFT_253880, partial [Sphaerobolus stellatus SS14]